jgi:hypothetical protein
MAQSRRPGPLGMNPGLAKIVTVSSGLASHNGRRSTRGVNPPGPVGLHLSWVPLVGAPGAVVPSPTSGKGQALIVVGTGHDGIKKGVRYSDDARFNQAILDLFAPHTAGLTVTLKHVKSAKEMKNLIESGTWEVVAYFGHGVENQMALAPQEGGRILSKAELVDALKKANPSRVILLGCRAGETGLARQLSKEVPGTTVLGTFESLDVTWEQGQEKGGNFYNRLKLNQGFTEYKDGFQMENGKKSRRRRHERGDPINLNGDLNGELWIDQ